MYLEQIKLLKHPILGDLDISFLNEKTSRPYPIVVFVGENGCGKTTLLNEIFNYNNSSYIIEKKIDNHYKSIFVRQDSKYSGAMNELTSRISGKSNPFPMFTNDNLKDKKQINGIEGVNIISLFNDPFILNAYESNKIKDIKCGGEILASIDNTRSSIDLTKLSSGQQEILLKLKAIENVTTNIDFVLFDEPETSLHPRWQKIIINFVKDMIKDKSGNSPQLFIATHSEKVMESLVNKDDVLIIRLLRNDNKIKSERINEMDLYLKIVTFAELDYVVFSISSYEYHDQLLSAFGDLNKTDNICKIDRLIKQSDLWKPDYFKKWTYIEERNGKKVEKNYKTLPVYIRNYFHHPKEGKEPTFEELSKSIIFLRKLLKYKPMV